ncbi:signal recognition particle-docking protein FtsY [Pontiella sulfatireligans]|uniref:Signal recognition particle receptor FtsY n=1 Tax=Pontiella sulfatireligans TaxID=2750658 RepID=A0A6C2ULG4_9BACT|nr:signal recognition particle-docking protein FtsY [Pontiella sulfatireligans]VGO20948.1 Signal recognition particle receptor FtsY [Pontiella sulfatireligans]
MAGWLGALSKTRSIIKQAFSPSATEAGELNVEELEEILLRSDVSARLVMDIVDELESAPRKASRKELLRGMLLDALGEGPEFAWPTGQNAYVLMLLGVNGSGKTTTAAKLAKKAKGQGLKPMLCGSDTFRAAGSSQLKLWSEKVGCDFVGGEMGSDAAGVAFNAVEAALAKDCDVVLVDTAGRMHTKTPLMDELPKMCRAMNKRLEGAPHDVWMVLDASLGQNAIIQAKQFNEVVPLTGIVVTKLDGSSKAGFLFSVRSELNVPILFTGLGEGEDDLVPFSREEFVDALFGDANEE